MPRLSWHGSYELKHRVLARIDEDLAVPRMRPLQVRGHTVELYGWGSEPSDLAGLRSALGLPVGLLAAGLQLFDGFPEGERGIRDVIQQRRHFLDAVPIGHELSWVPTELAARRLTDEALGVATLVDDNLIHGLLERIAEGLRYGEVDPADEEATRTDLEQWSAEIPRQWQSRGRVDEDVYARVRVLETAAAACSVLREPKTITEVITKSTGGVAITRRCGGLDEIAAALLELLGAPGAGG